MGAGTAGRVEVAYEAGPTGFGLARALIAAGLQCHVLAPSKMERPSGDRVKTDKRDSEWIARLVRLGELPVVVIPSEGQEAARDLVRAREDVRGDLMRARHRLSKLLLRQGIVYEDTAWTTAHGKWLRSQSFDKPGVQFAFDEAYDTVLTTLARRDRLDNAILTMAAEPAWAPVVARLGCLRGVGTLTGFGLAVEIGDWHRFTGNSIGSFLGLTPSEHSSGGSRSVGSITKTGNGHARRLLVESSWHHRKPYRLSAEMVRRRDGQSPLVRARADQANRRLISGGGRSTPGASARPSPPSAWPGNWPAGAGPWPSWTGKKTTAQRRGRGKQPLAPHRPPAGGPSGLTGNAWSDPRLSYE